MLTVGFYSQWYMFTAFIEATILFQFFSFLFFFLSFFFSSCVDMLALPTDQNPPCVWKACFFIDRDEDWGGTHNIMTERGIEIERDALIFA